jgi:hypothetical protein
LKNRWAMRMTTFLRNAVLGPTGSEATLLNDYRWITRTTTFLRNALLGPMDNEDDYFSKECRNWGQQDQKLRY